MTIYDATFGHVVRAQLNGDSIAGQDPDIKLPHLAADVSQNRLAIFQLHAEPRVREGVNNFSFECDLFFFCHMSNTTSRSVYRLHLCPEGFVTVQYRTRRQTTESSVRLSVNPLLSGYAAEKKYSLR